MSTLIKFTKMHGLGNDYIYVNTMDYPIKDPSALSIQWSKRHTGIGSDGLVLIGRSEIADFSMRIFNADGSEACQQMYRQVCLRQSPHHKEGHHPRHTLGH